jgi:hypothetical protein
MRINFKLFSRDLKNDKKALRVRVYHRTKSRIFDRSIGTGLSVVPKYWDSERERVSDMHPSQRTINERIAEIKAVREDLLNEFDANKVTPEQVLELICQKPTDDSIEDFIETKIKKYKTSASYSNYKNCLKGFKKLIGHKGKIAFSDLNAELFVRAHSNATKRQVKHEDYHERITSKTYNDYITSVLTLLKEARFYKVTKVNLEILSQYKSLDRNRDWNYHVLKNKGNTIEEVYNAIEKCTTIQQWQSIAFWLLAFCMRGFYYGDIVTMKQSDIKDAEDNQIGDLLKTFVEDNIHIYHRRGKEFNPMYIKIFKYPVLALMQRIKMSVVYTHNDRRFQGKSILGDINDQIQIFNYDYKEDYDWHRQMTKHIQKKLSKFGLTHKKARKSFNQIADDLGMSQNVRQVFLGHKEGESVIQKHYDDKTLNSFIQKVDTLHYEVLKRFKVEELYERLLVKLKYIVNAKKLPKWILTKGVVHRHNRKLKVLTGIGKESELEWTEIVEDKYRKYFIKDRRLDDDYWKDIDVEDDAKIRVMKHLKSNKSAKQIIKEIEQQQAQIKQAETKVFKLNSA